MKIQVNSKAVETAAQNLMGLARELQLPDKGVAIALDMQMVQRHEWEETPLSEGADVIVITAASGG